MSYVFICGALRSGTTLTHLMLNSHPELHNPGEFDFLFDPLFDSEDEPSIEDFISSLHRSRIFKSKDLTIDPSCQSYSDLLYSLVGHSQSGRTTCLNIHRNFDIAIKYFPDAKFVHMLRDPRDVAKSSVNMGWAESTYYGIDHWLESEKSWDRLRSSSSSDQIFEFRYEDLIKNTESTLSDLCEFLGSEFNQIMLNYHRISSYSKPDISLIEQWRRSQSPTEIELVEFKAGGLMEGRGYKIHSCKISGPNFPNRLKLWVKNKHYKYMFFIRRYGLFLFFMNKVIIKFPRFPKSEIYRIRIHQIQCKFLK